MDFKKHNVILLLQSMPKTELQSLKKFIASPYFNTNKNITQLFEVIVKFYPHFSGESFTKEVIYKKVFKGKQYSDANMRWMLSLINHLIEDFFCQKHFDRDILMKRSYLSKEYLTTMRKDFSRKALDTTSKIILEEEEKGYWYFLHKYIYYINELNHNVIFENDKKANDTDNFYKTFLKSIIAYLNHYLVGISYDYLDMEITVSKYYKNGISKRLNEIMQKLNLVEVGIFLKEDNEDAGDIEADLKIYNLFVYIHDDKLFDEFVKYLAKMEESRSPAFFWIYYSKLISYCWLKILNSVNEDFYRKELDKIATKFLENKYYNYGNIPGLAFPLFRLVISNLLVLGKIDLAKNIAEKYIGDVYVSHRENTYNYSKSLIAFYEKDFDNALLHSSKLVGTFLHIEQKALRIILFMEKGFYTEFNTELKGFRKFLKTNLSLSPDVKIGYTNFLFFVSHIADLINLKGTEPVKKLREKLQKTTLIYYRDWIEKKLEGL